MNSIILLLFSNASYCVRQTQWHCSFFLPIIFHSLEISKIRKAMFLRALNMAVDFASQNIISCVTFGSYVLLGNTLTAAKVFSSIAFLNALQRSVTRHFPPAVQKLNEAKITVKRIQVNMSSLLSTIYGTLAFLALRKIDSWVNLS